MTPLAYIGPGVGLAGLMIAIALVLGAVLLVVGLVWYPLKRVLRGRAGAAVANDGLDEAG